MALYGANASGKSNVLAALAFMKDAVAHSHRLWSPDEEIQRDPFAWGQKRDEPSTYEIAMVVNGIKYQYGFIVNDQIFMEEWLFAWPHGKKQVWLEREGERFKFGEHLRGENKLIEDVTRSNALFLSAAAQHKHPQLSRLFSWFGSIETINLSARRNFITYRSEFELSEMLEEGNPRQHLLFGDDESSESMLDRFKALLRNADIGIVDLRINKKEAGSAVRPRPSRRFEFKHQSDSEDAWLPLEEESRGTRTLLWLALPILRAIRFGKILLVDELESSMHPNLAEHIVRQFNDPALNTRNAQLIFSTHDTNLLGTLTGEPALRRDQVWLTEKDSKGGTVLYPLTDFKPRKDENLERGYVQGRYGAIPLLGNFKIPSE